MQSINSTSVKEHSTTIAQQQLITKVTKMGN